MTSLHSLRSIAAAALLAGLIGGACAAAPVEPSKIAAGHRLAIRLCSECHSVETSGASRLNGAPPFRTLYRQVDVGGLPLAFADGMMVGHPRMPLLELGDDEVDNLTAYLVSFIPPGEKASRRPICVTEPCER